MEKKKKRSSHFSVMLAAVFFGAVLFLPRLWAPNGGHGGDFDFYMAPVLPMTAISGGEAIEAERDITLDFTNYAPGNVVQPATVSVTDCYRLSNPTDQPLTVELAYPVYGQLWGDEGRIPMLTVDDQPIQATIRGSLDSGNRLAQADNFADFQSALAGSNHLAEALSPAPALDTPVKVYHISNFTWPETEDPAALRVGVIYSRTSATTVWKYGTMDMTENTDLGIDYMLLHVPTADTPWVMDEAWFLVSGPDVVNPAIQGYRGYEVTQDAMVSGVGAEIETFEFTLGQMLPLLAAHCAAQPAYDADRRSNRLTADYLADGAAKFLADPDYQRQAKVSLHNLSVLFYKAETEQRLLYQTFSLTIPAGESVRISARFLQEASTDSGGIRRHRDGFDLATSLGSDLTITSQRAALTGSEQIRILDQNYGFYPKKGITEVTLNPEIERYYLVVTKP